MIHHAEDDQTLLAVILSVVDPFERERITKDLTGSLEWNAVKGKVAGCLVVIPLEGAVVHEYTA